MTNSTDKHREEAREIVQSCVSEMHCLPEAANPTPLDVHRFGDTERLSKRIASALSARDAEVREVLEGLSSLRRYDHGQPERCWCDAEDSETPHSASCLAARELYARVQPVKENSTN